MSTTPSISYSFVVARNSSKKHVMLLVAVGPQSRARASHPPPHTHLHHALFNIPFRTLPPQHPRSSSKPSRLGCCCWRAHHAHASPAACMQEEKAKPLCCCMRYKLGSCLKHQSLILGRFQSQHDEEEAQQWTLQARPRHDCIRSLQRLRLQAQEGQGSQAVHCQEYG